MKIVIAARAAQLAPLLKAAPALGSPGWLKVVQIAIGIGNLASKVKRIWDRFRANLTTEEKGRLSELMLRAKDSENRLTGEEQREIVRLVCKGLGINWGDGDDVGVPVPG